MVARRVLPALLLLWACEKAAPPKPAALDPAPEPAAVAGPAEPSPAPAALFREAAALEPGQVVTPLLPDDETRIDPSASFRLELSGPSQDARLTLLDASNAAVPATSRGEIGEATLLVLTPSGPLTPGARYQLRLDGASTRDFHVGEEAHAPLRFGLKVIGQPPSPPPGPTHLLHRARQRRAGGA